MDSVNNFIDVDLFSMLQVITTDAVVASDVWRKMVQISVDRSFNQITV